MQSKAEKKLFYASLDKMAKSRAYLLEKQMNLAREYTVATQVVWPRPKHMDGFDKFLQFIDYDQLAVQQCLGVGFWYQKKSIMKPHCLRPINF